MKKLPNGIQNIKKLLMVNTLMVMFLSFIGIHIGYELSEHEQHNYLTYQLIAMVIEECKTKWNIDGSKVYQKLKTHGVITYLIEAYDCLHTQSIEYIVNIIEEMIKFPEEEGRIDAS